MVKRSKMAVTGSKGLWLCTGICICVIKDYYENSSWDSLPIVEIATGREMVLVLIYLVVEVFYDK